MIERLFDQLQSLARAWDEEAARRRQVLAEDPAAAGMTFCATALREKLTELDRDFAFVSAGEFGRLHGVSGQTVLNWIERRRVVGAELVGGHWRIPRDARVLAKSEAA